MSVEEWRSPAPCSSRCLFMFGLRFSSSHSGGARGTHPYKDSAFLLVRLLPSIDLARSSSSISCIFMDKWTILSFLILFHNLVTLYLLLLSFVASGHYYYLVVALDHLQPRFQFFGNKVNRVVDATRLDFFFFFFQ